MLTAHAFLMSFIVHCAFEKGSRNKYFQSREGFTKRVGSIGKPILYNVYALGNVRPIHFWTTLKTQLN